MPGAPKRGVFQQAQRFLEAGRQGLLGSASDESFESSMPDLPKPDTQGDGHMLLTLKLLAGSEGVR